MRMNVKEILKFKRSFLKRLKQAMDSNRGSWERFVVIKANAAEGMSMNPRAMPGATLLLDRHYTALTPNRKGEANIYAVRRDRTCAIKYVETADRQLILRPHNPACPIEVLTMDDGSTPSDYIVGRVCHVGMET